MAFQGLTFGGKFDADVESSSQYKNFSASLGKTCSCDGGDAALATKLGLETTEEGIYEVYKQWLLSSEKNPDATGFTTQSLWAIMFTARDAKVVSYHRDVLAAYNYLVENPEVHMTKCRMVIYAAWGQMDLLSPSSYIEKDPDNPYPTGTLMSNSTVKWEADYSHWSPSDHVTVE